MADEKTAARERLKHVIPHLKLAMSMAEVAVPGGKAELGILARRADGSKGHVSASFEGHEFLNDLILLVDDPELSEMFLPTQKTDESA